MQTSFNYFRIDGVFFIEHQKNSCLSLIESGVTHTMMIRLSYEEAHQSMLPGDVIAFGGSSHFSGIIKMAIRAEVSHIGIVLDTQVAEETPGTEIHYLIDSTSRQGVAITPIEDRIEEYDGDVWWLPLRRDLREHTFDQQAYSAFLSRQEGKRYDRRQAAGSAIDMFDQWHLPFGLRGPGYNQEDYQQFFCSELVAAGLKASGILPASLNASEVTPIDVCRWNIYEADYYLLKGDPAKEISQYNCLEPSLFETSPSPVLLSS